MKIHRNLISPLSIAVIGATDNLSAPGGKILDNLLKNRFKGKIYPVNPKKENIAGLKVYRHVSALPETDLAIIAVASEYVEEIVKILTEQKNTRAFIIVSAGFSDAGKEGELLEQRIVKQIEKYGGTLLGPNNIGLINRHYAGVFTSPVPHLDEKGVELISGSGATAVFIMEAAMKRGVRFYGVWTVGNSAQIGVEEILEYIDLHDDQIPRVLALYMEHVRKPKKLLKHARSLKVKGFRLVGIKAGSSSAGSRAAASHTGAMASPDIFIDALFRKAGILRAEGRFDLIDRTIVMQYPKAKRKNVGIITHAGGPSVMLTDVLEQNRMNVPPITSEKKQELKDFLYPGASVENPIDILATGTADQLEKAIDYTDKYFTNIDLMAVIFGSPGLFPVYDAYDVIWEKMQTSRKPLFAIMPSVVNVEKEIDYFINKGGQVFFDEVSFGRALADVYNQTPLFKIPARKKSEQRNIKLNLSSTEGFLDTNTVESLLKKYGIPLPYQSVWRSEADILNSDKNIFPVVMKAIGLNHKTEYGAVRLNIRSKEEALKNFHSLIKIDKVKEVLVQSYIRADYELFAGVKFEKKFGHLLMYGKGGVEIEIWKDLAHVLLPAPREELLWYLKKTKIYPLFENYRNRSSLPLDKFLDLLINIQKLIADYPEIVEMDFNPLIVCGDELFAVDVRMKVNL